MSSHGQFYCWKQFADFCSWQMWSMFRNMLPYSQINCKTISMCQDYFCLYTKQSIIVPSLHVDLVDLKWKPTHTLATDGSNDSEFTKMNLLTVKIFDISLSKITSNVLDMCTTKGVTVADILDVNTQNRISWDKCSFLCR